MEDDKLLASPDRCHQGPVHEDAEWECHIIRDDKNWPFGNPQRDIKKGEDLEGDWFFADFPLHFIYFLFSKVKCIKETPFWPF